MCSPAIRLLLWVVWEMPPGRRATAHCDDMQAPEVLVCPEKCRPEDNKNKISLVYGRTIDAWGMVRPLVATQLSGAVSAGSVSIQQRGVAQSLAYTKHRHAWPATLMQAAVGSLAAYQLHTGRGASEAALWHRAQGVLAYELIVGRPPFEKETRAATYECIMYRKPPYPSWLSDAARSFIDTALHKARSWLSSL